LFFRLKTLNIDPVLQSLSQNLRLKKKGYREAFHADTLLTHSKTHKVSFIIRFIFLHTQQHI